MTGLNYYRVCYVADKLSNLYIIHNIKKYTFLFFQVVLRPTGWHMDTVHHYPIILGTVPLESNDDDANPNESPDQPMPNVLYTNYPQNTPYPGAVPYPAPQMMPHPVSPYPPYPTYPVNSPVYPVANPSPAPTTNTNITVNLVAPSGGSS